MQTQTKKTRRSVVELDRARRSLPSSRPAGLDMLRLGDRKVPAAGDAIPARQRLGQSVGPRLRAPGLELVLMRHVPLSFRSPLVRSARC